MGIRESLWAKVGNQVKKKKEKKKKSAPRSVGGPHLGTQEATRRTAMGTLGLHILVVLQPDGREAGP